MKQIGLASYYSDRLAGRSTASGEPYRPGNLTAAHRALPLGTVVRVQRIDQGGSSTGATVDVRINDRGPYADGRIIDLSKAAARRLDMMRVGVIKVQIEVLKVPPPRQRQPGR